MMFCVFVSVDNVLLSLRSWFVVSCFFLAVTFAVTPLPGSILKTSRKNVVLFTPFNRLFVYFFVHF